MATTRSTSGLPSKCSSRTAWLERASMERSSGVLWSKISPLNEQKQVGMYSVLSLTKAGDVQSHMV